MNSEPVLPESNQCEDIQSLHSRFLPALLHELRSPVHTLNCFWQFFLKDTQQIEFNERSQESLLVIQKSISEMKSLVESLADYVHAADEKILKPIDVVQSIQLVAKSVCDAADAEHRIQYQVDVPEHELTLIGDRGAFELAAKAILANSICFQKPDTDLQIDIRIRCENALIIEFIDNGRGISPEYLHKVYEPFQRLQSRRDASGAGLGVPTAMLAIRHMQGRLEVESDGVNGTTVRLTFPIHA